jgi:hypothetical protein
MYLYQAESIAVQGTALVHNLLEDVVLEDLAIGDTVAADTGRFEPVGPFLSYCSCVHTELPDDPLA